MALRQLVEAASFLCLIATIKLKQKNLPYKDRFLYKIRQPIFSFSSALKIQQLQPQQQQQ